MLIWFVVLYLLVSIGIGLYAATRVHNTRDYAVAGRSLPLYVVTAAGARRRKCAHLTGVWNPKKKLRFMRL